MLSSSFLQTKHPKDKGLDGLCAVIYSQMYYLHEDNVLFRLSVHDYAKEETFSSWFKCN